MGIFSTTQSKGTTLEAGLEKMTFQCFVLKERRRSRRGSRRVITVIYPPLRRVSGQRGFEESNQKLDLKSVDMT